MAMYYNCIVQERQTVGRNKRDETNSGICLVCLQAVDTERGRIQCNVITLYAGERA
jgi:hypothetical protein